jgi:hypothetical protein
MTTARRLLSVCGLLVFWAAWFAFCCILASWFMGCGDNEVPYQPDTELAPDAYTASSDDVGPALPDAASHAEGAPDAECKESANVMWLCAVGAEWEWNWSLQCAPNAQALQLADGQTCARLEALDYQCPPTPCTNNGGK